MSLGRVPAGAVPGPAPSLTFGPDRGTVSDDDGKSMRTVLLSSCVIVTLGVLAGCSSSSEPEAVGGMTECTKEALATPAQDSATALGAENVYSIDTLECADGWAVTSGILGPANAPADGPQGAPTNFIFEAEGQFWIPKAMNQVCGTFNPDEPDAYPADAVIPEALYTAGCLS